MLILNLPYTLQKTCPTCRESILGFGLIVVVDFSAGGNSKRENALRLETMCSDCFDDKYGETMCLSDATDPNNITDDKLVRLLEIVAELQKENSFSAWYAVKKAS